jgi:UDP-N-acetyl-2-amino-2-deoxyglucuronate dehydrogenase
LPAAPFVDDRRLSARLVKRGFLHRSAIPSFCCVPVNLGAAMSNRPGPVAGTTLPLQSLDFALIGVAGFVAPRHLRAIRETGNKLVAAVDPHDSVGVLDNYFPETQFFTEIERFDRFLEKRRRPPEARPVEYVAVCTPNYLHDAHIRLALRVQAHAICEKPLVINPWNLDQLRQLEEEYRRRVYTVLQLRVHPAVRALKQKLGAERNRTRRDICLTYITRRGCWYQRSWKGIEEKSGGLVMNIGVHFFDLLLWLFGAVEQNHVHQATPTRTAGYLELQHARVRWLLSVDVEDLPAEVRRADGYAYRSLSIDGEEVDLSAGFTDLHTEVYRDILAGGGFGIEDSRPSIELVHDIRCCRELSTKGSLHPLLAQA